MLVCRFFYSVWAESSAQSVASRGNRGLTEDAFACMTDRRPAILRFKALYHSCWRVPVPGRLLRKAMIMAFAGFDCRKLCI